MLGKSSVLMMLLVGTGSLVGISSMYQPANVETQPQQQPQGPQTTIPGLKMPQSKIELGQQIADQNALRAMQDKQLLDRLMPEIIKRIDVKLVLTERPSKTVIVDHGGLGRDPITTKATCAPGETAVAAEAAAHGRTRARTTRASARCRGSAVGPGNYRFRSSRWLPHPSLAAPS